MPILLFAALVVLGVATGNPSHAADQPLFGKSLYIKNPAAGPTVNRLVYYARDPAVVVGAAGGAGEVTIPLPCAGWTTNEANTRYVYRDPTGTTCKLVIVRAGILASARPSSTGG